MFSRFSPFGLTTRVLQNEKHADRFSNYASQWFVRKDVVQVNTSEFLATSKNTLAFRFCFRERIRRRGIVVAISGYDRFGAQVRPRGRLHYIRPKTGSVRRDN